jgi:hypothetical protein
MNSKVYFYSLSVNLYLKSNVGLHWLMNTSPKLLPQKPGAALLPKDK